MKAITYTAIVLSCLVSSLCAAESKDIANYAEKYRLVNTGAERRSLCIEMIDKKVLKFCTSKETVYTIFGAGPFGDGIQRVMRRGDNRLVIHFDDPPHRSVAPSDANGPVSPSWPGWYLSIRFDDKDQVNTYYISDSPVLM
jgi:hypothetical protein